MINDFQSDNNTFLSISGIHLMGKQQQKPDQNINSCPNRRSKIDLKHLKRRFKGFQTFKKQMKIDFKTHD